MSSSEEQQHKPSEEHVSVESLEKLLSEIDDDEIPGTFKH